MGEGALALHRQATVADVHAHPSLKVSLFQRSLGSRGGPPAAAFSPFSPRTSFPRLEEGGVDVLFSALPVPEASLLDDVPLLKLLRRVTPNVWAELVAPPYYQVTMNALAAMEAQVEQGEPGQKRFARVARRAAALDAILAGGDEAPLAIVHPIEGAHCLQGIAAGKHVSTCRTRPRRRPSTRSSPTRRASSAAVWPC